MTAFGSDREHPRHREPLSHKDSGFDYFRSKCASSSSGARNERRFRRVTERQAQDSQPVRVRSGETPGSPVARLPASGEIPASKRSNNTP